MKKRALKICTAVWIVNHKSHFSLHMYFQIWIEPCGKQSLIRPHEAYLHFTQEKEPQGLVKPVCIFSTRSLVPCGSLLKCEIAWNCVKLREIAWNCVALPCGFLLKRLWPHEAPSLPLCEREPPGNFTQFHAISHLEREPPGTRLLVEKCKEASWGLVALEESKCKKALWASWGLVTLDEHKGLVGLMRPLYVWPLLGCEYFLRPTK